MSLVKDAILSVARKGEITHEFTVAGLTFVLRSLKTEEQFIADGMVDSNRLKDKYGASNLLTLNDTIHKHRTIAMVSLATQTVNGKSPVDSEADLKTQYKQREELRNELMELNSSIIDEIIREFQTLTVKQNKFYENVEENMEK